MLSVINVKGQIEENLRQEIETIVRFETNIDNEKIPAFVVAVIIGDSSFYFTFGDPDFIQNNQVNERSIFEIGALTTVFTALSTIEFVHQEGIHLKDDFSSYLSEVPKEAYTGISIENLLTHTSGFPFRPLGFGKKEVDHSNPFGYYTKEDLKQFLLNYSPKGPLSYHFSSVNYAILEMIIEENQRQEFTQFFKENIKSILGLEYTDFDYPNHWLVPGKSISGKNASPWTYQSFKGAVGLKSNLLDLTKFATSNFEGYDGPLKASIDDLQEMKFETNKTENTMVGYGWHGVKFRKYYPLIALGGVTEGHSSFMAIVPKTQTAVVILSASPYEMDGLGFLILRMINNNWKMPRGH